mmetsp:Transcript_28909/g.58178  ORF Transcript_28909/g.58178 Transcript_28909/m.58178 type:complete len:153 (-) Transcript_28909:320-778(-)
MAEAPAKAILSRKREAAQVDEPMSSLRPDATVFVPGAILHSFEAPPAKRQRAMEAEAQEQARELFESEQAQLAIGCAMGPDEEEQKWLDEQLHVGDMAEIETSLAGSMMGIGAAVHDDAQRHSTVMAMAASVAVDRVVMAMAAAPTVARPEH